MNIKSNSRVFQRWIPLLAIPALSAVILSQCSGGASRTTAYGSSAETKPQLFTVASAQMQHLQIATVRMQKLPLVLRLPGTVTYNAFETTTVITQVNGPVSRIVALPGQHVRAGQPMCYVSSPDFAQLRSSYIKAQDAYRLADENYKRSKDLYEHHAIAQVDLLQAKSARNQAQAELQSAGQALRVIGITQPDQLEKDDATSASVPVLAPISGVVVDRMISPGQVVQAGSTQAFTISNVGSVWVLVNVYQSDLGHIHRGDEVAIQTDAYSRVFHGRISYIAPALDPVTRTLSVRIVTANPDGMLKKDMYVTAIVQAGEQNSLAVPDTSILRNNVNEPFVYQEIAENQFGERRVTIGRSENGKTQILSGLKPGDKVAADGSLFLQFARSLQQ